MGITANLSGRGGEKKIYTLIGGVTFLSITPGEEEHGNAFGIRMFCENGLGGVVERKYCLLI